VNIEILLYGALIGVVFVIASRLLGVPFRPWREALAIAAISLAAALALRYAGVDMFFAVLVGFILVPLVVEFMWKRLERRPA
jgi:hypothetical protein